MSFDSLPQELLLEQLLLLPPEDVIKACRINRQFAEVGRRVDLWIRLIRRDLPLVNPDKDPKKIYLAAIMIKRRFPEVRWIDLEDPIAFCDYSLENSKFVHCVWNLFSSHGTINYIRANLRNISWNQQYGFHEDLPLAFGNPPIYFPNILVEPILGEVLLHKIQREHPQIYQAVIENLLKERVRLEARKIREEKLRYTLRDGQYLFQYQLPDGSLHSIDLSKLYLPTASSRRALEDAIIKEMDYLNETEVESIHEDSLKEMTNQEIHYAVQVGQYRLRYQLDDGIIRLIEVPEFYRSLDKLEGMLLNLKSS